MTDKSIQKPDAKPANKAQTQKNSQPVELDEDAGPGHDAQEHASGKRYTDPSRRYLAIGPDILNK